MPIQLASSVIPKGAAKWPIMEDIYIKGGMRTVVDAAARDAIYADNNAKNALKVGMLLITQADRRLWIYMGLGVWAEYKPNTSFCANQADPADTWHIAHGMNSRNFNYAVFDSTGLQVFPNECQIVDNNNLMLSFLMPISGSVTITFYI
jgi:hypothetical protein